jgi:hypothetical protein
MSRRNTSRRRRAYTNRQHELRQRHAGRWPELSPDGLAERDGEIDEMVIDHQRGGVLDGQQDRFAA